MPNLFFLKSLLTPSCTADYFDEPSMNLHIHRLQESDCQTAMSLAWAGIVYCGGFALRSNNPETPSQEASR